MTNAGRKLSPNDPCWCGSGVKYKKCHQGRDLLNTLQGDTSEDLRRSSILPAGFTPVRPAAISPRRAVPPEIVRPDYADSGRPGGKRNADLIKTPEQIARMRRSCRAARQVLETVKAAVAPGVTTDQLDAIAHAECIRLGGYPSPLNYHGFPKSLCTSVNEVICHGIPDARPLQDGDIVNLDVTLYLDGMHGDLSETVAVGSIDETSRQLIEVTRQAMYAGIGACRPGARINEIGRAIEAVVRPHRYGIVRAFVGHGIGELFHLDPQVPHYFDPSATFVMRPGQTFTIEPMINLGAWQHETWSDGWTAVTADRRRSAQHEHTVLITDSGVEILTLAEGQAQPFPG
jgi:methionyl aminopeptidase